MTFTEKLKSGERKNKFCSKECQNKAQITADFKICLNCGNEFRVFNSVKEQSKFCSQNCYNEYRKNKKRLNVVRICPVCGKEFKSEKKNQKFCSSECCGLSQKKRIKSKCDYCKKEIEYKPYQKSEKHYCSILCRKLDQKWNKEDIEILEKYYRKIPSRDIIPLLSKPYTIKAIRSEAGRRDLSKSRLWTVDETNTLLELYPNVSMSEVIKALPNRSIPSIMGKTRTLGITSFFYNQKIYTNDEIEFLKNNYLTMTNEELGYKLGRNPDAIQQRLFILDLHRPFDSKSVCYKNIATYIRAQNATWRNHIFEKNNYTCYLCKKERDVVIHHCRGFNLLLQETIDDLEFEIKDDFGDYQSSELDKLYDCFAEIQDYYGEYVCINKDIHRVFHNTYGYGDNTMQQWIEFEKDYKSGKYQEIII